MEGAVKSAWRGHESVASERMSIRKAAEEHGVPRSTLHDKVSGKVALKARSGTKKHLTDEEEAHLVDFLLGCASIRYAKLNCPTICQGSKSIRQSHKGLVGFLPKQAS